MIPGIVGLASYLTRRRDECDERDERQAVVAAELRRATLGDVLRVCVEQADAIETSGVMHVSASRHGDELHVGVRFVIPLRAEALA